MKGANSLTVYDTRGLIIQSFDAVAISWYITQEEPDEISVCEVDEYGMFITLVPSLTLVDLVTAHR